MSFIKTTCLDQVMDSIRFIKIGFWIYSLGREYQKVLGLSLSNKNSAIQDFKHINLKTTYNEIPLKKKRIWYIYFL